MHLFHHCIKISVVGASTSSEQVLVCVCVCDGVDGVVIAKVGVGKGARRECQWVKSADAKGVRAVGRMEGRWELGAMGGCKVRRKERHGREILTKGKEI